MKKKSLGIKTLSSFTNVKLSVLSALGIDDDDDDDNDDTSFQ